MTRLERSLQLLRELNDERLANARDPGVWLSRVRRFERMLDVWDRDCRAGHDARQLNIYEALRPLARSETRSA